MRARVATAALTALFVLAGPASIPVGAAGLVSRWARGVTVVRNSPLPPRNASAVVAMNNRVLVFGGGAMGEGVRVDDGHRDGAILDLRSQTWRKVAPAPFRVVEPTGVWTGRDVVVVGTEVVCSQEVGGSECRTGRLRAGVFTASTDTWREVALPVAYGVTNAWRADALGWTGSEAQFSLGTAVLAIDPADGSAHDIPDPPLAGLNGEAGECATRRAFVRVGLERVGTTTVRLVPLTLAGGTSAFLPGATSDLEAGESALVTTCTRDRVFVASRDLAAGATYDVRAGTWSSVAPAPTPCAPNCAEFRVSGHGNAVDAWQAGSQTALRYDAAKNRWSRVTPGPGTDTSVALTWAGGLGITTRFDPATGRDTGELVVWRPM